MARLEELKRGAVATQPDPTPKGMETMMEHRWLPADEIATNFGIKPDTASKWISERQMPGHTIGRLWKFSKEEVDEWVRGGGAAENTTERRGVDKE